ncbi:MAG: tyrosine-type recombinase/integrase [Terriglobales bacterium]
MNRPMTPKPRKLPNLRALKFRDGIELFLESRRPFIRPHTLRDYNYCLKHLVPYFGDMLPTEITADHLREYQVQRYEEAGSSWVNHECSVVQQLLKRCNLWEQNVGTGYQPLPLPKDGPGRCLTDEEEERLLRAGSSQPRWVDVYLFTLLSLHTTMGPGEVMGLRRKHIDLTRKTVSLNPDHAKNRGRIRTIEMNEITFDVCKELLVISEGKGASRPDHYVFPFRVAKSNRYDPTRCCTTFRTSWSRMLKAAKIKNLRMYDLRHTAITRLCEDPNTPEEVIESIAGHLTHGMKKRYSHIRTEARRAAIARLLPARVEKYAKARPSGSTPQPPSNLNLLTNRNVLDLFRAGLPDQIIVAKIGKGGGRFDTSIDALMGLKTSGVPDSVILAMVQA